MAAARANRRVDEALEALAAWDMPRATELLGDPDACHAFHARDAGEVWRPPVAKAAGPDHRAEIRKAVAGGDHAELDCLVRLPDGGRQYHELLMAGEFVAPATPIAAKGLWLKLGRRSRHDGAADLVPPGGERHRRRAPGRTATS
jgi:hypothetical protein